MDFRKAIIVITVITAAIMELIDTSIVNVALSQISGNLGATIEDTSWDNFEWHLGPTKRFGLYEVDLKTKEMRKRPSADIFRKLAYNKMFEVNSPDMVLEELMM